MGFNTFCRYLCIQLKLTFFVLDKIEKSLISWKTNPVDVNKWNYNKSAKSTNELNLVTRIPLEVS